MTKKKTGRTTPHRRATTPPAKAVAGTPYAAELSSVTRQRGLVRKSLATIGRMQQASAAQSGKPSTELTKLAAQLRARDKRLVRRQAQLVAAARSWKVTQAAAKKHPATPRLKLTGDDLPTATSKRATGHSKSSGSAPVTKTVADSADPSTGGSAHSPGPITLSDYDAACAVIQSPLCADGQATGVATASADMPSRQAGQSQRPDPCILAGSGEQTSTSDGQPTAAPQYCFTCPRRIPLRQSDATTGQDIGAGDTTQACALSTSDTGSSAASAPTGSTTTDLSGLCLVKEATANGGTAAVPENCVLCPATAHGQNGTGDSSSLNSTEILGALCASLKTTGSSDQAAASDQAGVAPRSDTAGQADPSSQSQQTLLCPGQDGTTYRPCAPCPTYQPLATANGTAIPLCLLNDMSAAPTSTASSGATGQSGTTQNDGEHRHRKSSRN